MPDYGEHALEAGWVQEGAKWKHKNYPGVIYYNAKQIWDERLPDDVKRPTSATPPEKKPEPAEDSTKWEAEPREPYKPIKLKPARGPKLKRDRSGYLVPKED